MAEISSPAIDTQDTLPLPSILNVLVIDTDLSVLEYIKHACPHSSYQVIPSSESLFAANLLRERKQIIHLILIEVHMPLMDGYEFMQFLNQEQINVPLIMMSTDNSRASITKAFEVGACDYWIKPLYEDQVVNMWTHVARNSMRKDEKQKDIGSQKDDDITRVIVDSDDDFDVDDDESYNTDNAQWSTELDLMFHYAIMKIGLEMAEPKKILEAMNVPGLEIEDVASHLEYMRTLYENPPQSMLTILHENSPESIRTLYENSPQCMITLYDDLRSSYATFRSENLSTDIDI